MIRLIFAAALALGASAATAQDYFANSPAPGYYRVTGVALDDTLNVRAGPSASTADIGDLQPHDVGIEVLGTDPSGAWGRIIWQESMGWVAMRFLAPDPQPTLAGTAVPVGMYCGGTEPFWSIRLSAGSAIFSDPFGTSLPLTFQGARVAEGRPNWPAALSHTSPGGNTLTVIVPALCSDGMSDRDYGYAVMLTLMGPQPRFLDGCCQLQLESGSH